MTIGESTKIRVQCRAMEQRLTGRNNDQEYVYTFEPELILGIASERLSDGFSFRSCSAHIFAVGSYYELDIKSPRAE